VKVSAARSLLAVIGVGNVLLKDEGVGVHALRALMREVSGEPVMYIDGGTDPWSALMEAECCSELIILDAVAGDEPPGMLYRLRLDELANGKAPASLHDLNLVQMLVSEALRGNEFERVTVLGMQPEQIGAGTELSERCRKRMPELIETVRTEIDDFARRTKGHSPGERKC